MKNSLNPSGGSGSVSVPRQAGSVKRTGQLIVYSSRPDLLRIRTMKIVDGG